MCSTQSLQVDVDVVLERQPAVAARRAAPVDRVDIDAERQQVAQHRAVFLQVGHRVAADLAVGHQHRHADRALGGRLVAVQRRLVLAEHHLLVGGGDLHVLVLQALQHLLAARQLQVEVARARRAPARRGLAGRGHRGVPSGAARAWRPGGASARRARLGMPTASASRRRRAGLAARRSSRTSRRSSITVRCISSISLRVGTWLASHQASAILRSCSCWSDAARSMRRCASTNSSERWTSISVSLATASHGRSGRARSRLPAVLRSASAPS